MVCGGEGIATTGRARGSIPRARPVVAALVSRVLGEGRHHVDLGLRYREPLLVLRDGPAGVGRRIVRLEAALPITGLLGITPDHVEPALTTFECELPDAFHE